MENKNTYDLLPYYSKSFSSTTPLKIASVLQLLGFKTKDIRKSRVLELGCSYGGNVLPLAIYYPESEIIGVDLSKIQIDEGNKVIENIGLKNIKLIHKNILDIDESFGKFDYIICHGVYSWVPKEVKEGILKIISNNLTENGAAFISYNCYPGWKKQEVLRDAMNFRVNSLQELGYEADETIKTKLGLGAIEFLHDHSLLNDQLKEYSKELINKNLYYIYHEYLETNNDPIYIYDFSKELKKYSLMHVIDTSLIKSPLTLNHEQSELLKKECEGNHILKEQYLDFLRDTQFRKSIIINEKNKDKVKLRDSVLKENLDTIYVRGKYEIKENKAYYLDSLIEEDIDLDLIEYLIQKYPNTVSIKELVEKFDSKAYNQIFKLILISKIDFYPYNLDIKYSEKLKLKDEVRKYIEYFVENKNPVISFANFQNNILEYQDIIFMIFKLFDGTRTKQEVIEFLIDNLEDKSKDDDTLKEEICRVVKEVNQVIISDMMNE